MFDTIYIYVPTFNQIVRISEGTGDNLLDEDIEAGYVDYIYYEQYSVETDFPEVDGGMVMLKELFRKQFNSTKDCIPNVLDMAYGNDEIDYILLDKNIKLNN
jgi:hypothetical protein